MVDIIIVNWNSGNHLRTCIESVLLSNKNLYKNIIIVDNGSSDGSTSICDTFSDAHLLVSETNLGFGKACNLGAKQSCSEYLLFLNPDAALYPDTLQKVLIFMQDPDNADVGICGVQLLDDFGKVSRSCARFPTCLNLLFHATGLDRIFPSIGYSMLEWSHNETCDVDQVIGAFFMVRRDLFESLGGFDERFFVYFEELDFSFRARRASWRSVYLADIQAFHAGGGTSNQAKAQRLFYSLRSRLLYSVKHFSALEASAVIFFTLLVEPLSRSTLMLFRLSWPSLKETWQGYVMLWCWLPKWMFKGVTR